MRGRSKVGDAGLVSTSRNNPLDRHSRSGSRYIQSMETVIWSGSPHKVYS